MKPIIKLLMLLGVLVWGVGVAMAAPPIQTDAGQEYTVQPGDCLAKIAERSLGSQRFWPAIWRATNVRAMADSRFTLIRNPDLIHSGQILWLPSAAEVEMLMPQTGFEPSQTASKATTGLLVVDIVYYGQWYRDTFHYSKEAPNIRHFAVIMPEAQYQENPHVPGQICSSLSFPLDDEPLQIRSGAGEVNWDLSVLHPVPYQVELEPGRYYVGGCFIAAPLSPQEASVGDETILYAGITGGGASSDYQVVTIEPGGQKDITIALTDKDGWACPWLYVYNGRSFERRTEILRNIRGQENAQTEVSNIGPVKIIDNTITLRISEEEKEISFIDEFYIFLDGQKLHPEMGTPYADKVAKKDHNYLTINYGQAYEFRFKTPDSFAASEQGDVSVFVSGFYLPARPQLRNEN